MAVLNLASVMTDLAAAVQTVLASGRTAFAHVPEAVQSGDAVVGFPQDPIAIAGTFRRGLDRLTVPVFVLCGQPQDTATRDAISSWLGSGSVVAAIEGYSGTWGSVSVTTAQLEEFAPIGGPSQVAIRFNVDVIT